MKTTSLLIAAALLTAPAPAFALTSGQPAGVSCQDVQANPSVYNRRVVAECRHSAALGYSAAAGPRTIVTRDSSCSDVRANPYNFSESVRVSCGGAQTPPITDWGGSIVH
jgi:hypothetical protein